MLDEPMEPTDRSDSENSSQHSVANALNGRDGSRRQGLYWILTLPKDTFKPEEFELVGNLVYLKGQLERGEDTGYEHWQLMAIFKRKVSLIGVKSIFGIFAHAELTRSSAAEEYVWKEATRVDGTQFELGRKPIKRNEREDWERVWQLAVEGDIFEIPAQIRLSHYRTIRSVYADFAQPSFIERSCVVFWGPTGTGKSRRAWSEAGTMAYPKDPRSKFWCGYQGQENVIIDEFRGDIDISHLLRWLDRYPVIVEVKGSSVVLNASRIWITSNLHPRDWYPNLDDATFDALLRRLEVLHFDRLNDYDLS